jgi:hypothetical protein
VVQQFFLKEKKELTSIPLLWYGSGHRKVGNSYSLQTDTIKPRPEDIMKMDISAHWKSLLTAIFLMWTVTVHAQNVMNNAEVIALLEAGMPDDVILAAISNAKAHKFDTSAKALITLKNKGASPAVLRAMMNPKSASVPAATGASGATSAGSQLKSTPAPAATVGRNPEEVTVVVEGREQQMQYIIPTMRTAVRVFGFGGAATYATLPGTTAQRRLPGDTIEFIISVPKNAQPQGYLTLANFAIRNNGTREVGTGSGYLSYSTGIARDRVVPVSHEPLTDQRGAREGFVLYRVKPERALVSGEYALVLYTAEVHVAGFFGHNANSFFDFGVD